MTVTSTANYKEYQGNGIATTFTIPFLLLNREDLQVFIDNTLLTIGYTLTGIGNPISSIIFTEAPTGLILLQRSIALLRDTDYQENGDLLADTLNRDFDRIYLALQGTEQDNIKSLRVTDSNGVNALPLSNIRANKLLGFDSQGQPLLTTIAGDSAVSLAGALADITENQKGASLVGFNSSLDYPANTVGQSLKAANMDIESLKKEGKDQQTSIDNLEDLLKKPRFTVIYPNGGTKESPATVAINNRYIMDNPFKGHEVYAVAEVLIPSGVWGTTGWIYVSTNGGHGVKAGYLTETDSIVVQTGSAFTLSSSPAAGGSCGQPTGVSVGTPLPCRVKVWRVD